MRTSDTPQFAMLMNTLGEMYGKEITEVLSEVYWNTLKCFEWIEIKKAVGKHIADPDRGRFMPKPADIIYWIQGTNETRASLAWSKVMDAMKQVGSHKSITFDDLMIHAAIEAIGGWVKLGMTKTDHLSFVAQDFKKYYIEFLRNPPGEFSEYLVGMSHSDKPVNIGSVSIGVRRLTKKENPIEKSFLSSDHKVQK